MKTVEVNLSDIKPYWRNPRDNTAAVHAVKQSIENYGMNQPLVLDTENVIVAGHTRYKALLEMGAATAPCVIIDLPPQKAKEYRIADNKTSELAVWDITKLIPELRELEDAESMQVYFGSEDLTQLLEDTAGMTNIDPTNAQIDALSQQASTKFDGIDKRAADGMVELICPECGHAIFVSRADIANRLDHGASE